MVLYIIIPFAAVRASRSVVVILPNNNSPPLIFTLPVTCKLASGSAVSVPLIPNLPFLWKRKVLV